MEASLKLLEKNYVFLKATIEEDDNHEQETEDFKGNEKSFYEYGSMSSSGPFRLLDT